MHEILQHDVWGYSEEERMAIKNRQMKLIRCVALVLCLCLILGTVTMAAPGQCAYAAEQGTVIATSLYVRRGPGTTYTKMTVNGQ